MKLTTWGIIFTPRPRNYRQEYQGTLLFFEAENFGGAITTASHIFRVARTGLPIQSTTVVRPRLQRQNAGKNKQIRSAFTSTMN